MFFLFCLSVSPSSLNIYFSASQIIFAFGRITNISTLKFLLIKLAEFQRIPQEEKNNFALLCSALYFTSDVFLLEFSKTAH